MFFQKLLTRIFPLVYVIEAYPCEKLLLECGYAEVPQYRIDLTRWHSHGIIYLGMFAKQEPIPPKLVENATVYQMYRNGKLYWDWRKDDV